MRDDGGVDADEFAAIVDERAAGIARIDGSIRLEEVLVVFDTEPTAALGADDAFGYGLSYAERVANRNGYVAHFNLGRIANGEWSDLTDVDLENRNVRLWIGTHDARFEFALIGERDLDVGGAVHDVIVGENVAFRTDDYTGAESLFTAILGSFHTALTEKLAEHGIHVQLLHAVVAGFDNFRRRNIHD